jgi:putative heme transporter
MLVGIALFLVGVVWLLSLTDAIVMPVITAAIVAAVLSPVADALQRRGLPRAAAAALLLVGVIALGVLMTTLIVGGIGGQADELRGQLQSGAGTVRGWLEDAGVGADAAGRAQADVSDAASNAFHLLLVGAAAGLSALASVAVFLSFAALSLFFLLKDGPLIRSWAEEHMGVTPDVAHIVIERTLQALRGYFAGVTAIAVFNAAAIGLAAVLLRVPNAGSIAVVNFVCAYIPYLGAWSAGAFTVLIALGSQGTEIALVMAVICLLANGMLQQMIQPVAFGATLDIHPLGVLIVTIAAGSLFGAIGLILAAPLTSAALRVSSDLARAREPAPSAPVPASRTAP